jgi:hypothetical protein
VTDMTALRQTTLLIAATIAVTIGRLFFPTTGHSWAMVYIVVAHIFVGILLTLLWLKRGRWLLGWVCLGVPTVLETVMFFTR